jgi:hypothetical protein
MKFFNLRRIAIGIFNWLLPVALAVFFLPGCDKFEGDQTIPSYLKIDSLGFVTDNDIQGTNNQMIVDAWVYVDDDLIGGFELPATIPVLAVGKHKLEIRPGIILNGISDTRAPYPCIEPVIINEFNFAIDSIVKAFGTSSYQSNAEFVWMEDFEDASLAIKRSPNSDTGIVRTQPANAPGAFIDDFSQYSAISYLDETRNYLQLVSDDGNGEGFVFDRGDFIFLELNYRNNIPLVVGVYIKLLDNTIQERSFLIINPSDDWNKIYVNFTPIVNETIDAVSYTIYFESQMTVTTGSAFIMLDNIKLVTRPNL